jgi:hypothetical protein
MRRNIRGLTAITVIACASGWFACLPASAANAPPDFAPDSGTAWVSRGQDFLPPPSGPGPVVADAKRPRVTNDDLRAGTGQPMRATADLSNPILQPWAREELKKRNDLVLSGDYAATPKERCWPIGVPGFVLYPVQPVYFVQTSKEVVLMWAEDHQVRHIYMDVPHSPHVTPSWFGESIGHYEGDTLVVDTVGLNTRTYVDSFLTPHTDKLHVVERYRIVDDGKALEVQVHVEDPGAFTRPWNAIQRYRRVDEKGKATDIRQMGGPLEEMACAENNNLSPIPAANRPDF